ncbi:urate hydroxylase PuuD [Thalassospira sp. MCCC 1A01428]|uniref:urate hydroxylase PuuD n=1 Tax=Thalassospira sp. MCCC 1A01428 TaxID=1470575 RepID=UPI000A1E0F84|nr:urate hydroxylase PuuD [Thalassospira sp. MCCC 1A01428]OSQ43253.1 cysteine desulfurase [Thalassospira sp. MCCC 1A01428]
MDILFQDWINLILRWAHVITGIAWIGSSFYFVWLDLSLRKRPGMDDGVYGEAWMVHGGGFYHVNKWMVAPAKMPDDLHWFKYEAYFTWLTGFALLVTMYYWSAESYLIDPSVMPMTKWDAILTGLISLVAGWFIYDLICKSPIGRKTGTLAIALFIQIMAFAWIYTHVFSGRGAFIHVGALIGTMMAVNVFRIIIPNQKKVVASLMAGEKPDPALGLQAKQRSTHNNYLTLPVLAMMISNHYPMTYAHDQAWVVIGLILIVGGLVRHFFNTRNSGGAGKAIAWQLPAAAVFMAILVVFVSYDPSAPRSGDIISSNEAMGIIQTRCAVCHSAHPTEDGFDEAPAGVMFDSLDQVHTNAQRIMAQAVIGKSMPLGNLTEMTDEERAKLGQWIRAKMPE